MAVIPAFIGTLIFSKFSDKSITYRLKIVLMFLERVHRGKGRDVTTIRIASVIHWKNSCARLKVNIQGFPNTDVIYSDVKRKMILISFLSLR